MNLVKCDTCDFVFCLRLPCSIEQGETCPVCGSNYQKTPTQPFVKVPSIHIEALLDIIERAHECLRDFVEKDSLQAYRTLTANELQMRNLHKKLYEQYMHIWKYKEKISQ